MWSPIVLCFLVGVSFATSEYSAWKENTEYTYEVRGRSLASLHEVSREYTGILLRAKLVVQAQSNDKLRAKILQPEYAEVQTNLPEGWMSNIPDSQLNYQRLQMTEKPFDIVMKNSIVKELIVEKDVPEWEANIIKSFVSQLQLDTSAQNAVESKLNVLPKEGSNNAVFKTLEDTVTGITETTYDIHPLPEYILQSEPHLAPFPHLKGDGSIIEIVKSKNFSRGHELPSYYFGLGSTGKWTPESNQFGEILQRSSLCRSVVTGTLQRYTIQYSETKNEIIISPTRQNQQKGSVSSMMRIKLTHADQQSAQLPELQSPVNLGSLVYAYGTQDSSNKVSSGKVFRLEDLHSYEKSGESDEERSNYLQKRHPRSLRRQSKQHERRYSEESVESDEDWTQPKPKLSEAPKSPMLPFTTGYKGLSIKEAENIQIVDKVCKIAQQIGNELENVQEIPKKQTLAKYAMLTAVLRIMNHQDLEQVAQKLYTQETEGRKCYAWCVFRDALAETGTGPALLLIRELIENKKIQGNEAEHVIVTMGESSRTPTEEYIRTFYEMVKTQLVSQKQDNAMLNETMLFSFSSLIGKVYVDRRVSHKEYPTHSFGKFNTKSGRALLYNDYIPYISKQLRESIANGDDRKTHALIRALGLVGDREMIYTFEPYLEGKVQCSQFQRFLMVMAFQNVVRSHPKAIAPVLYRIYQNVGEITEIRVAAVYMLMHTSPSADMLQRMAMYTHLETDHKVCGAVKTAIESASKLKGIQFSQLRSAAQSAKSFLTEKKFGIQDSLEILETYASKNWQSYYKGILQTIVGEKSGIPSSFYLAMRRNEDGYEYRAFSVESLISDIRNVFHVFLHETEWYQQQKSKNQQESKWASSNIARLLNLQTEDLEQLEGGLFFQIGEWKQHLLFNNHSIEKLPEMLKQFEETWSNGKKINFMRLINNGDSAIAFPTEIGLPFIYSYDLPILMKVEGTLKAKSEPKISSANKLATPDRVTVEGDLKIVLSAKKHTEFGLFTPFNHQHYSAGYDQNIQVNMPIKTMMEMDLKKKNFQFEAEFLDNDRNTNILHKSSWPFISKHDILALQTIAERKDTQVIRRRIQNQWENTVGDETVGMKFRVKYENDDRYPAIESLMKGKVFETSIQYEQIDVDFIPANSQNKKLKVSVTYDSRKQTQENQEVSKKDILKRLSTMAQQNEQRVDQLSKLCASGIYQPIVRVLDSEIEFSGKQNVRFTCSIAHAMNHFEPKSRILAYMKKQSQLARSKPLEVAVASEFNMARTNGLDMDYVMKSDLTSTVDLDVAYGEKLPTDQQVQIHAQLSRSDARKQYLLLEPTYHRCQRQMQQDNKQLLDCAVFTQLAGLLDRVKVKVEYHNMQYKIKDILQAYNSWSNEYDFEIERNQERQQKEGEMMIDVHFHPDLQRVNVSVADQEIYARIHNIQMNKWAERVFVVHPTFDFIDRVEAQLTGSKTYKPICTMDKTKAYTFDGSEYPLSLKKYWTVLVQYVPLRSFEHSLSSTAEQLKHELENYVILGRESTQGSDMKEVKIVVSTPRTEGNVIDVEMKPSNGNKYPQVFVNGKQVPVTKQGQAESYHNQVTIAGIPNGEVVVKVHDAFYVVYDGVRVKITSTDLKLRNRVRGLCGTFNGRQVDDFTTPSNCVIREAKEFIASYTVMQSGEQDQEIMDLKSRAQKNHCIHKKTPIYVNYISEKTDRDQRQRSSCSKYQTRYITEEGRICFSIKPLTVCKNGCQKRGSVLKNVEVHCVENKNVANLWKTQIDRGVSPDFSQKPVTKTVQMEVPQTCRSM